MLINQFLDYLSLEKKYSLNTIKSYDNDLNKFKTYLFENNPTFCFKELKKKDIREYIVHLSSLDMKAHTVNRSISSIRAFYNFLIKINEINISPVVTIKGLKSKKQIQIPFSKTEINNLLSGEYFENNFPGVRDRLILELLYQTGIRKTELISIKKKDIDLIEKTIKVKGKRDKQRIIPITNSLSILINKYIDTIPFYIGGDNILLRTNKGEKLYPKFVYNTVEKYLSKVSTKQKKSPHMLRHSIATHLLQNGADINSVKELLGHNSLVSTQVYTHQNIKELKKMFNKTHPRELKK